MFSDAALSKSCFLSVADVSLPEMAVELIAEAPLNFATTKHVRYKPCASTSLSDAVESSQEQVQTVKQEVFIQKGGGSVYWLGDQIRSSRCGSKVVLAVATNSSNTFCLRLLQVDQDRTHKAVIVRNASSSSWLPRHAAHRRL